MRMNDYLTDATRFLAKASSLIGSTMETDEVIDCALFMALGIERLLKSILSNIKPIYVLKEQDFKNTAPLLYADKIKVDTSVEDETSRIPIHDDLSFRISLSRARLFSQATNRHASTLFFISTCRDTIAHRPLVELKLDRLKEVITKEFLTIAKDFAAELEMPLVQLIGDKIKGLEFLGRDYTGQLEDKLFKKLAFFRAEWARISEDASQQTRIAQLSNSRNDPTRYDSGSCPACGNVGVFKALFDYDYSEGSARAMGVYPTEFRCSFCGYFATDSEELDHLGLTNIFYNNQEI